jgi:putative acetyltransferase
VQDRIAIQVVTASDADDLDAVRDLMRSFVAWHRELHVEDRDLIDGYFDPADFADELAHLPGKYAPPAGALLLARCGGEAVGCVALRRIDAVSCEMKRMFVRSAFQGRGVGRALAQDVIRAAREAGYVTIWLDTSFRQTQALALYRSLGFVDADPYYELPSAMRDWLVFMRLMLPPVSGAVRPDPMDCPARLVE